MVNHLEVIQEYPGRRKMIIRSHLQVLPELCCSDIRLLVRRQGSQVIMGSMGEDNNELADFFTVRLDKLEANDSDEIQRLWAAGVRDGFFYLDMSRDKELLQLWRQVLEVMSVYFAQDVETKMRDCRGSDTVG